MLSNKQLQQFQQQGYLLVENAVDLEQIAQLQHEFSEYLETSRNYTAAYGETLDGRPRFDLETTHSAAHPALRRVASPTEISATCLEVVKNSAATLAVVDLIGPNVRYHHGKFNSKLPNSSTVVQWHQDFTYEPHSNDDTITVLVFVDPVTLDNGPLQLAPGSHQGALHSLWHDGVFTGAVSAQQAAQFAQQAEPCIGKAGAACLMHGRVAHASGSNQSATRRTLFIYCLTAADAVPLSPNPLPSKHAGMLVAGVETGRIRSSAYEMAIPEVPTGASFFVQQAQIKPSANEKQDEVN